MWWFEIFFFSAAHVYLIYVIRIEVGVLSDSALSEQQHCFGTLIKTNQV